MDKGAGGLEKWRYADWTSFGYLMLRDIVWIGITFLEPGGQGPGTSPVPESTGRRGAVPVEASRNPHENLSFSKIDAKKLSSTTIPKRNRTFSKNKMRLFQKDVVQ